MDGFLNLNKSKASQAGQVYQDGWVDFGIENMWMQWLIAKGQPLKRKKHGEKYMLYVGTIDDGSSHKVEGSIQPLVLCCAYLFPLYVVPQDPFNWKGLFFFFFLAP